MYHHLDFSCCADVLLWGGCALFVISVATYLIPQFLTLFHCPQNLRVKYDAEWALVTGGSSGIGLAVARRLAADGLNLVIVAVPDKLLQQSCDKLADEFPDIEVRSIGCDLSKQPDTYLPQIEEATDDISIQCIFCNAGYIKTGFFDSTTLDAQLANLHCNATSSVAVAHHFIRRLREDPANPRGCVVFTSSPAMLMPCPFSCMYGATKAFITSLATSMAAELTGEGIDVSVCHPSPVLTRFYDKAHALGALDFFKQTGTTPEVIAYAMVSGVGRRVIIEQGYYPFMIRMLLKVMDVTLLAQIITFFAPGMADYQNMRAEEKQKEA